MIAPLALVLAAAAAAPLTLDDALELASRRNGDLRLARLEAEGARVDLYASWAGVLPSLDLGASFGTSYSGPRRVVVTVPQYEYDAESGKIVVKSFDQQVSEVSGLGVGHYTLGLQLRQPLFDGLRGPRAVQRARLAVEAAQGGADEAALSLSFQVTRLFYEAVKADRRIAVLEETVARSEEFVRRAEALFDAGRAPRSEAVAARVNLGNDRVALESARAAAVRARADLAQALGVPPAEVGGLAAGSEVDRDEPALREPPPPEALLQSAAQRRPAFARARALAAQATLDRALAGAERWPTVYGSLSYDRAGPDLVGAEGVWGNPARQYVASAGLGVQWNLFNGRQTLAAERRADLALEAARIEAERLALQVESDLVRARAAVVSLGRAVALGAENLAAAEEGLRLARERLEAGAATQLEVRDAALKLLQARLVLQDARIDALVARAELGRAAGGPPEGRP